MPIWPSRQEIAEAFQQSIPADVALTPVSQWEVMGTSVARPNIRDLVTGAHRYPSDIARPDMLYGKILRPPSYGATLESIDLSAAEAMEDVVVVRDGAVRGVRGAVDVSRRAGAGRGCEDGNVEDRVASIEQRIVLTSEEACRAGPAQDRRVGRDRRWPGRAKSLSATYEVAYVQHAPMEPRAATAEWKDGKLTVWTGVDGPQRVQGDLSRALGIPTERVRVIVPDMGGGFGGKHTGEAAEEAARLAKAAGRPVAVHWTRAEEFTWAYFRPAAVIECQGGLDDDGSLVAWDFTNINAGGSAIDTPYEIPNTRILSVGSDSPLRQGAYRCLAATANNFARESFMDELAAAAEADPLAFRLAHLENTRIRTVLEVAAKHFDWAARKQEGHARIGCGLGLRHGEELGGGGVRRSGDRSRAAARSRCARSVRHLNAGRFRIRPI